MSWWRCSACGRDSETKTEHHAHDCPEWDADEDATAAFDTGPRPRKMVKGTPRHEPRDLELVVNWDESLRMNWADEADDFTPWLTENIEALNEALDTTLRNPSAEVNIGPYRADITAETTDGHRVVIENQLTRSDHAHLGKLLTYGQLHNADLCLWIAPEFSAEHLQTCINLTQSHPERDFYPLKISIHQAGAGNALVQFIPLWS